METINELAIPPFIPKQHPMSFTGTGSEYFRIWIVNLALTILTLGIYSAWAKVRKNRYFYGHTKLVGESFGYHASPISILKGRLLAAAIFGLYYFISQTSPAASFPFLIVLTFASPWLICRSLAFNAVNSSYRNIRFRFIAKYVEALKIIVGIGFLIFLTLGFLFPFYQAKRMRFIADHHFYGRTRFNLEDFSNVTIYKIYGKLSALILACIAAPIIYIAWASHGGGLGSLVGSQNVKLIPILMPIVIVLVYLLPLAYIRVNLFNALWNSVAISGNRFISTLRVREMYVIYLTNFVTVVCTLGLATPWAMVRTASYKASHLKFVENKSLETFIAENTPKVGAAGEAISEMFDLDIGIG